MTNLRDDDLCIHDLLPVTCSICKHGLAQRPPEPDRIDLHLTAKFSGDCPECSFGIHPGQRIVKLVPSERYAHESCWS